MFNVHSSCISNMKTLKTIVTRESVSSKYRAEPESRKSNVNGILN